MALALASLEAHASVADFARCEQGFEIGERFIDDHGADFRCRMHGLLRWREDVAFGRLFEIENVC